MSAEVATGAGELIRVVSLLGAAVVAVPLFKRLGLSAVLGYLTAGLVIGPFGLKLVNDYHSIIHIAEFGVVMFLFVIGLEMKPSHLWNLRNQIFGLGSLQVGVCSLLMTLVSMLFDISWEVAFVCASGFVLTSTAIVMQVLDERNEIATPAGQKIVSVLLFEDLLIVPLLAIMAFLSPHHSAEAESAGSFWQSFGTPLLSLVVLLAVGRWLLNPLFRVLARSKAREVMLAAALFVVLGAALLMEAGGLSMAMGAFVAGVMLSESSFRHQLEADIEPFRGLLLGLFFLGVGMSLNLTVVAENWKLIGLGVAALMITKAICIYVVARLTKSSPQEALKRALIMAQGGEFAFVLLSSALVQGVIDERVHANMTATVVISMAITPLILMLQEKWIKPAAELEREDDQIDEQHPILIIGFGRFGQIVNEVITMAGHHTTIIDKDPSIIKGFTDYGIKSYFGDASHRELLLTAGAEKAGLVVVAIDDPEQSIQVIHFIKEINPTAIIVARAFDRRQVFRLYQAGATDVFRETFGSALNSGKRILEHLGLSAEQSEQIGKIYLQEEEQQLLAMSKVFDEKMGSFENKAMLDIAHHYDKQMKERISDYLQTRNPQ